MADDNKVEFSKREYFGSIAKWEGKTRLALFLQRYRNNRGSGEYVALGEEYKSGEDWRFGKGKTVTFKVEMIEEVQKLINSIKQDDVVRLSALKIKETDTGDPF